MQRSEFIDEVFTFFRCTNEDLKRSYDLAFTVKEPIDWSKLYRLVITETESRYLPAPKWFRDRFYRCYKVEEGSYGTPDGIRVRMALKSDKYGIEIRDAETYHISYTLEQMKMYKQKQYGEKFISFSFWDENNLQWVRV